VFLAEVVFLPFVFHSTRAFKSRAGNAKGSFASFFHFALFRVDAAPAAARTGVSDCAGFAPN
jgi:hypothetical protein